MLAMFILLVNRTWEGSTDWFWISVLGNPILAHTNRK
jgi:hypothetical protein